MIFLMIKRAVKAVLEKMTKRELIKVIEYLLLLYSSDVASELEKIYRETINERKKRRKVVL